MKDKHMIVSQVRELGPLFAVNDRKMIGQDAAYSIPIRSGESLWVFGDTFIGTIHETGRRLIERMPSNAGLLCRGTDAGNGLADFSYLVDESGMIRQLIPFSADEDPHTYRLWGMDGCMIHDQLYLFYVRVRLLKDQSWPFKFEIAGTGLARAHDPEFRFERILSGGSSIWWSADQPCYGAAVLHSPEDGYIYIYGSCYQSGRHFCRLARTTIGGMESPDAYEYLISDNPSWTQTEKEAISIMEGMPTEMSVSYNEHLGAYLAVHSWETSGQLVGRLSPDPWGPWSEPTVLWTPRIPLRNPLVYNAPLVYAGKEHAEYSKAQGKIIYVSYVEFEEYFPRLIELTFS